jgi:hypothetical protein
MVTVLKKGADKAAIQELMKKADRKPFETGA